MDTNNSNSTTSSSNPPIRIINGIPIAPRKKSSNTKSQLTKFNSENNEDIPMDIDNCDHCKYLHDMKQRK